MKTPLILTIVPIIILLSVSGHAQSPSSTPADIPGIGCIDDSRLAEAEKNYVAGLESDNDGLVESSLYYATQLRLKYPERDFRELERAVDRLVAGGGTACIRYKAMLASTIFAAPRLIDIEDIETVRNCDDFFATLSDQLEHKLLVRNE